MLKKAAALIVLGVSLVFCLSCGKTANDYVYAAIPASSQIAIYREDPNSGILTQLDDTPIAAGPAVQALALHPSKKFLYAANSAENDISLFTIATDGMLTEVTPRTSISNGTDASTPTMLAMDPGGAYLYVGNAGGTTSISVFSINSTSGQLTPISGSPFAIGISPLNMVLAPGGNILYVTGGGAPGWIEAWNLSSGVLLSPPQLVQPGTNPYGLAISPNGSYLYTANTGDNSISEFSIGSSGLTEISGSPIGESYTAPLALLVDNTSSYLFVANEGSTNLAGYSIGSGGGITLLASSPFATNAGPDTIASDTAGKYLFVGNQSSPVVQSFGLNTSNGTLEIIQKYAVPGTVTSIVVASL
jgi:6-phosphogluconolactonase